MEMLNGKGLKNMNTEENHEEEESGLVGKAEKLLERIETEHKNTFLVNNKRFVIENGIYFIDDEDELQSIDYHQALSLLHSEIKWIYEEGGEYQGEWVAVGEDKEGIWYYKRGSYGSCSGCDWYQGIEDKEGAIDYIKAMMLIDKVGTKEELIEYLKKEKNNGWGAIKDAIDKILKHF
jgi:hypothetical protein